MKIAKIRMMMIMKNKIKSIMLKKRIVIIIFNYKFINLVKIWGLPNDS